jgi:hypothetical protein
MLQYQASANPGVSSFKQPNASLHMQEKTPTPMLPRRLPTAVVCPKTKPNAVAWQKETQTPSHNRKKAERRCVAGRIQTPLRGRKPGCRCWKKETQTPLHDNAKDVHRKQIRPNER